ncbi:SMI1/KNR4 family protein [Lachnoanaerobaculum umeaense]|uniref:SMI1/KNR4 family protein n=1 Tax=Lachnoanaerobaculum umeaense TaxID=617123 RepID=UPI000DB768EB|nr:SMI1/KNR4 family protein [Lachnoanaerobaculum umeaense]PZW92272.1 hypothetical protein C7439_13313 [Lachnoanaerobaculum umeaense]
MVLKKEVIPHSSLDRVKQLLEIEYFDHVFSDYILKYNWCNVGFLSYQFGYNDEIVLDWLVNRNLECSDYHILQKEGLIIIANGDPYTVLLECKTGNIYVFTSDTSYDNKIQIASYFEELIKAMGTGQYSLWNNIEKDFIDLMSSIVTEKGLDFWKDFVGLY